jgi:hypothetical protein
MIDLPGDHPLPHAELANQNPLIFTLHQGDVGAFSTSFNSAVAVCDSSTPASSTNRIRLVCDRDTYLAKTLSSRRLRQPHAICDVSTLQPWRMWK